MFEIKQGVAISLLRRHHERVAPAERLVRRSDLSGSESTKYDTLATRTASELPAVSFRPLPPELVFASLDNDLKREYAAYISVPQLMGENGDPAPGIVTTHDEFAISFSKEEQIYKVESLLSTRTEAEARELFTLCSQNQWVYADAKRALRSADWRKDLVPILYRPFDKRWTVYSRYVAVHRRERVSRHLVNGGNVGLITTRQTKDDFACLACNTVCGHKSGSRFDIGYMFPLWLEPEWPETRRLPNLSAPAIRELAAALGWRFAQPGLDRSDGRGDLKTTFGPRDVFDYVYGIIYAPGYRSRYNDFLKSDFARIPLTPSRTLFGALVARGTKLVALHLLESAELAKPITEFIGGRNPEVEKVSWSKNTVWIDKAQTIGFKGVREDVWNFHIGGYQVCEKWLKDRKDRRLSKDDIAHYHKIVVALTETIRLMKEIDEIIEQHGGWPGAFQSGGAKAATAKVIPFRPRTVEPKSAERYVTCVPLVPLKAAAGAFGDPQHIEDDGFEWVAVESRYRLRPGMFVAQVVGKSMESAIPDGAYCLFRAPVEGARQGKTVLVQLRDATDPETGQRYTVKRYESEKVTTGDSWRHDRITLKPVNPDFAPIVLIGADAGELQVIAELVEVLGGES